MTPTSEAIRLLGTLGFTVGNVERRTTRTLTKDLFGCGDLFAFSSQAELLVQVTSCPNHSTRVKKCRAAAEAISWLATDVARHRIVVMSTEMRRDERVWHCSVISSAGPGQLYESKTTRAVAASQLEIWFRRWLLLPRR